MPAWGSCGILGMSEKTREGGVGDNAVAPREQKEDEDEDKNVLSNRMKAYQISGTDHGRGGRRGGGRGGH